MKRTGAVLIAVAVALLVGATAAAIPVRGTLELPRDYSPPAATGAAAGFYWEEWNGVLEPRPRRVDVSREVAVVLLGSTEGERPDSTVRLQGGALHPSTMIVQAGSTLRVQNTDGAAHELFSEGIEGFSPLQTAPGNARTIQLPSEAGHHVIRDRLYPHVEGHLHLVPNLVARGEVASDGRYVFADVPEGNYTLEVYYDDRKLHSQPVEVSGALTVDPVRLDLSAASQ